MEEFIYLAREARAKILPYVYERGWDLLMYKDLDEYWDNWWE